MKHIKECLLCDRCNLIAEYAIQGKGGNIQWLCLFHAIILKIEYFVKI